MCFMLNFYNNIITYNIIIAIGIAATVTALLIGLIIIVLLVGIAVWIEKNKRKNLAIQGGEKLVIKLII